MINYKFNGNNNDLVYVLDIDLLNIQSFNINCKYQRRELLPSGKKFNISYSEIKTHVEFNHLVEFNDIAYYLREGNFLIVKKDDLEAKVESTEKEVE